MTDSAEAGSAAAASDSAVGWDDPPRRPPQTEVPVLSVEGFEGPRGLLLEMVRAQKIYLARLSILALVEAFATTLEADLAQHNTHAAAPLWRWGDRLVMAANLALLRSRLLLPVDSGEAIAARDEGEVIRRQLVGRLQLAAAVDWLEWRPQLGHDTFSRGTPELRHVSRFGDMIDLLRACLVGLRLPADSAVYRPPTPVLWRVTEAKARIQDKLAAGANGFPAADRRRRARTGTCAAGRRLPAPWSPGWNSHARGRWRCNRTRPLVR